MPKVQPLTLPMILRKHKEDWSSCTRCPLHEGRTRVVLGRGKLPCDILFTGEAPGPSEDVIGRPFVGPAGHLLDRIINRAIPHTRVKNEDTGAIGDGLEPEYSYAITNLVACIPKDADGSKVREPDPDDIIHCSKRLDEFVRMANPRLIVCVGKLAENWIIGTKGKRHLLTWYNGALAAMIHPAAIIRMHVSAQGLQVQKAVINLTSAIEELETNDGNTSSQG